MCIPGKDWEQEEVAPACTPDLQSEPARLYRTLCRTEQGTLPAERAICMSGTASGISNCEHEHFVQKEIYKFIVLCFNMHCVLMHPCSLYSCSQLYIFSVSVGRQQSKCEI